MAFPRANAEAAGKECPPSVGGFPAGHARYILDSVLTHMILLGHPSDVIEPSELHDRCRVLAERLLADGRPAVFRNRDS